jgi:regulator of sigma E protease
MSAFIAVAVFLPLISVLVVVHELGHLFAARWYGIKVLEFGLGYPPRLFGIRTGKTRVAIDGLTRFIGVEGINGLDVGSLVKLSTVEGIDGQLVARTVRVDDCRVENGQGGDQSAPLRKDDLQLEGIIRQMRADELVVSDMLYSLNVLPLGGFVRLAGENNPNVPRSLASRGVGPRFVVLSAGAFMNAMLAIVVFTGLFMMPQEVVVGDLIVEVVRPGSPAELAGVLPGDVISEASGYAIKNTRDLSTAVGLNVGSEMEWEIRRNGGTATVYVTPRWNPPQGEGATGIEIAIAAGSGTTVTEQDPPWTAVRRAFTTIGDMALLTKNEVISWFRGKEPVLAGPVGIAQIAGEVAVKGDIWVFLAFGAFLSMNLAVLNILPIPMLDGGRIVFVVIEWMRRGKRVPPEKEALVHMVGFALLVSLVLVVTFVDISRIAHGGDPLR